jgi:hypothetical protein
VIDTSGEQKQMMKMAQRRIADLCLLFLEIQQGPNPLTKDEIRKLVEKRADYGILRAWAK